MEYAQISTPTLILANANLVMLVRITKIINFKLILKFLFLFLLGSRCEILDACLLQPNTCKNGGVCQMSGNVLTCVCPIGYEQPYCEKSSIVLNVYCQVNVCRNGGTCIHTNDNTIASMKCMCLSAFTGVFCETQTLQYDFEDKVSIPSFCKGNSEKSIDDSRPFKVTRTPFSYNGFYIIQGMIIEVLVEY
jgi:hypothetical protein